MAHGAWGGTALVAGAALVALSVLAASIAMAESQDAPVPATGEAPRVDVGGVRVPDPRYRLLWIPRVVLFVPRMVLEAAGAPLRLGVWAWERYRIPATLEDFFFNDDRTVGLYPVVAFDTVTGLEGGLRFVHRDLFGRREHLSLLARFGGRFDQEYRLDFHTGQRGEGLRAALGVRYTIAPTEAFFGIGNRDVSPEAVTPGADPRQVVVPTRYRRETFRGAVQIAAAVGPDTVLTPWIEAGLEGYGTTDRLGDYRPLGDAYARRSLAGFDGYARVAVGVALDWDTMRPNRRWLPSSVLFSGWQVGGSVAVMVSPDRPELAFLRYAAHVERWFDLFQGSRVLRLRAQAEGVAAPLQHVPFAELPTLGGPDRLRGYQRGRFRDRFSVLQGVEYRWLFTPQALAYLFVDAGRVFDGPAGFTFRDYRVGFGGGFELVTDRGLLMRIQLSSSRNGGFLVDLAFDPGGAVQSGGVP